MAFSADMSIVENASVPQPEQPSGSQKTGRRPRVSGGRTATTISHDGASAPPVRRLLAATVFAALAAAAPGPEHRRGDAAPLVEAGDVERFFAISDRTGGLPDAAVLQEEYLDWGSPGLQRFAELRRLTGRNLAAAVERDPGLYRSARACAASLPELLPRLTSAARRLRRITDAPALPSVTIVIGRGRPVGVGAASGAYIGLEALCAWKTPDPDFRRRALNVIVHELAHTQQRGLAEREEGATVLEAALVEGAAEFVTELVTGSVAYRHLAAGMAGREADLETRFLAEADAPAEGSRWVFNQGASPEQPSDLGYRIGYRIVRAYYAGMTDKRAAIQRILNIENARAFLESSGWRPGMQLR
jgi:hypothetical protein